MAKLLLSIASGRSIGRLLLPALPGILALASLLLRRTADRELLTALCGIGWSLAFGGLIVSARLYVEREDARRIAASPPANDAVKKFIKENG